MFRAEQLTKALRYDIMNFKGDDKMPQTKAHIKATMKYNAKAYDRAELKFYKGQKEQITEYAKSRGLSLNAYINKLIADDMGAALTVPNKQQGD